MKTRLVCLVVFPAVSLVTSACQEPTISRSEDGILQLGSIEVEDTVERVVAPGQRSLTLDGSAGSIKLVGTDSDVARFSITRYARGDSPEQARSRLQSLDIEETGDETAYRYRFVASENAISRFDVEGTVPESTPVRIHWVAGEISLDGISGNVNIQGQHGDVHYSGNAAVVQLSTRNGTVTAQLSRVDAGSNVFLLTANGDVAVSLPTTAAAHIEATTSAGFVSTGSATFVSESYVPTDAGARFQGRMGAGTGRVALATQHGSVDISAYVPVVTELQAFEGTTPTGGASDLSTDSAKSSTDSIPQGAAPADTLK